MSEYVDENLDEQSQGDESWLSQPVAVFNSEERLAPEYGSCMTWQLPVQGTNGAIPVLNRRLRRHKAKWFINFPGAGTVILNSNIDHTNQGVGYTVTVAAAGIFVGPDWESQQPLYALATITGVTFSVIDESYSER